MLLLFDVSKCFFVERSSASNGGSIHMARTSGSIHMDRYTVEHALDRDIAPGGVFVSSSVCSSHAGNASEPMNVKSCTFRRLVGQGV